MPITCPVCRREQGADARYCAHCGTALTTPSESSTGSSASSNDLNLRALSGMTVLLILAVLFPPWEAPPADPPAFLGLHPLWSPPTPTAIVSRMLLTIETMTIAIGGIYLAWWFRGK